MSVSEGKTKAKLHLNHVQGETFLDICFNIKSMIYMIK